MFKCTNCGKFIWSIKPALCNECAVQVQVNYQMEQFKHKILVEMQAERKKNEETAKREEQKATNEINKEPAVTEVETKPAVRECKLPEFEGFTLSQEQYDAFKIIEASNDNYFITGNAGTGKSVVLRYFIKNTKKKIVVLAPTGMAAINIDGETIHSFFKLKIGGVQDTHNVEEIRKSMSLIEMEKLRAPKAIVIDEISMVRCDVMDMIDLKLKIARKSDLPFGGCQILAFGDMYQLPPVVERKKEKNGIAEYLEDNYTTEFFFEAPAVKNNPFKHIVLQKTHRQTEKSFIDALNSLRIEKDIYKSLTYINENTKRVSGPNDSITIAPFRKTVDIINNEKLDEIPSQEFVYEADVDGSFEKDYPTDRFLKLKVGAKVMMLTNDSKKRWVNGTVGIIEELLHNENKAREISEIRVRIKGYSYPIDRLTWSKKEYRYDKEKKQLVQTVIGSFTQYPIKLAYAITIHKSQGQTYDSVTIDYSKGESFGCGQTYVALSRCRSINGIFLTVDLKPENIQASKRVEKYMNENENLMYKDCGSIEGAQVPIKAFASKQVNSPIRDEGMF